MTTTASVIEEVAREREAQEKKWGPQNQNHEPGKWFLILSEEVGEAAKEALEAEYTKDPAERMNRLKKYRDELIQCAAVAISMVESVDRNELAVMNDIGEWLDGVVKIAEKEIADSIPRREWCSAHGWYCAAPHYCPWNSPDKPGPGKFTVKDGNYLRCDVCLCLLPVPGPYGRPHQTCMGEAARVSNFHES